MSALFCDRPPVAPSLLSACSLPPSIERYFATINAGCFQDTAALFAPTGALFPPFEIPITGRDRLTTYLQQEADGMELVPLQAEINDHGRQFAVIGRVKTLYFKLMPPGSLC
ncbi:MAG: nuclear transport factor 2 family protein [Chloroflexaceae bacterium]|nr:nuclear transport factor 2 family protein [Chloroflexaceae bacterium]